MGTMPSGRAAPLRGERRSRSTRRRSVRRPPGSPRLTATMRALDELVREGAQVGIHVSDVDSCHTVLSADAHVALPVADLGVLPVLVEAASQARRGPLDPEMTVERVADADLARGGIWRHMASEELPLFDVAVLAATTGDRHAANTLLDTVGHGSVIRRMAALGMVRSALLDRFRDSRGPDDAPHAAIGTAGEYASLMHKLVRREGLDDDVADTVTSLMSLRRDVGLVGGPMALDPFADDADGLILINQTGRGRGIVADAGVAMGRSAALAYALIVRFEDPSYVARLRAHRAFQTLGEDLLEIVV